MIHCIYIFQLQLYRYSLVRCAF